MLGDKERSPEEPPPDDTNRRLEEFARLLALGAVQVVTRDRPEDRGKR